MMNGFVDCSRNCNMEIKNQRRRELTMKEHSTWPSIVLAPAKRNILPSGTIIFENRSLRKWSGFSTLLRRSLVKRMRSVLG
jgi:hypothetical protein